MIKIIILIVSIPFFTSCTGDYKYNIKKYSTLAASDVVFGYACKSALGISTGVCIIMDAIGDFSLITYHNRTYVANRIKTKNIALQKAYLDGIMTDDEVKKIDEYTKEIAQFNTESLIPNKKQFIIDTIIAIGIFSIV